MATTEAQEHESMIREGVAELCKQFPGEYWRELDREQAYPTEFVRRLFGGAEDPGAPLAEFADEIELAPSAG